MTLSENWISLHASIPNLIFFKWNLEEKVSFLPQKQLNLMFFLLIPTSEVIFNDYFLPLPCVFFVCFGNYAILIRFAMKIKPNWTAVVVYCGVYFLQTSSQLWLCLPRKWKLCLMWNCWSTKHFHVFKSSASIISKLSLITTAVHWNHSMMHVTKGTAVLSSNLLPLQRRPQPMSIPYCLLCRCAVSHRLSRPSRQP